MTNANNDRVNIAVDLEMKTRATLTDILANEKKKKNWHIAFQQD